MKNTNKLGRRLWSLLLAMVMVVSMLPAQATAEDAVTNQQTEVTLLEAVLTATENAVETEATEETEETEGDTTPAPATYSYGFTAKAEGADIPSDALTCAWTVDGTAAEDVSAVEEGKVVVLTVNYKGMTVTLSSTDLAGGSVSGSVKVAYSSHTLTAGAAFAEDNYKPTLTVTANASVNGADWSFAAQENSAVKDGVVGAASTEAVTVGNWELKSGETVLYSAPLSVTVTDPTYTVSYSGADVNTWYTVQKTVTVTATANTGITGTPANLPEVKVDGTADTSAWAHTDGSKEFTKTITLDASATITVEGKEWKFLVDTTPVTVDGKSIKSNVTRGNTNVTFNYTIGESGLASVEINGEPATIVKNENGQLKVRVAKNLKGQEIKITVKNVAGATNADVAGDEPTDDLAVELGTVGAYGEVNGVTYLTKGTALLNFEVQNALGELTAEAEGDAVGEAGATVNGNTVSVALKEVAAGEVLMIDGLKVTVTDAGEDSRTAETSLTKVYAVDNAAPVVKVDEIPGTAAYISAAKQTYNVTVTDLGIVGVADLSLTYVLAKNDGSTADETKTGTWTAAGAGVYTSAIEIPNGYTLKSYKITAEDISVNPVTVEKTGLNVVVDNEPAQVTIMMSDNVTGIAKGSDGKVYVTVPQTATSDEVVMTVTAVDATMDAAFMEENGWTKTAAMTWTKTFKMTVAYYSTGSFDYSFAVKDLAGNYVTANQLIQHKTESGVATVETITSSENAYSGTIYCDRRSPSSEKDTDAPEITATPSVQSILNADGKDLYSGSFVFSMTVHDKSTGGVDSGLKSVSWKLDDDLADEEYLTSNDGLLEVVNDIASAKAMEEHTFEIQVNANGENETNKATLLIAVEDYAGNTFTYAIPEFAVDTKAPEVTVTKTVAEGAEYVQTVDNTDYYNGAVTYSFEYSDINILSELGASVATVTYAYGDGTEGTIDLLKIPDAVVTVEKTQVLTDLVLVVKDANGNTVQEITCVDADNLTAFEPVDLLGTGDYLCSYVGCAVAVDEEAPVVTVSKITEDGTNVTSSEKADYYNGEVTFRFEVTDQHLTNAAGGNQQLQISYTKENGDAVTVALPDVEYVDGVYTYEIPVAEGEALTDMSVVAIDNAGNVTEEIAVVDENGLTAFEYNEDTGANEYTGHTVVVDSTPAVVEVKKEVEAGQTYVQTVDTADYYDGEVTYTVTVTDLYLNDLPDSSADVVVTYEGVDARTETMDLILGKAEGDTASAEETYTASFQVLDGETVTDITILVKDNAGNVTETIAVVEADELTSFAHNEETGVNAYTGNDVIVDKTDPTATLEISGDVNRFYVYKGVVYVELKEPGVANSGSFAGQESETVTLTVTVEDKNLLLSAEQQYGVCTNLVGDTGAWTGTPAVNEDSKVVYTKTLTAASDKTNVIEMDLTVFDLAGHAVNAEDVEVVAVNNTLPVVNAVEVDGAAVEGRFAATVSLDRRLPSSVDDDTKAPVITITPDAPYTTANGMELYDDAFSYKLSVTDGVESANNSGIQNVTWSIEDAAGFVKATGVVENKQEPGVYSKDFTIPVNVNGTGESNDVILKITAVDNVGNTVNFVKEFGVDNQAPRITVDYGTGAARNEMYFNFNRTANITVTDINFNPATTTITTEVPASGWVDQGDGVWTNSCSYTTDGRYTFSITSTDRAENTTTDEQVNYIGDAPRAFVIDKTNPVIQVDYDPGTPVGQDPEGVKYYNQELDVTVTIIEVNFRANDVDADLGPNNALGGWNNNGNIHTASETFEEGNEYSFSVAYTDLAGNPANTYTSDTFSVDLTAPTIEIVGDLTNEELNIVQGDLDLGFTINDEQANMKNVSVKVMHLNNEFQTVEVTGDEYYTVADQGDRTTVTVNFAAIAQDKGNDGLYTVEITAEDYAGHTVKLNPELVYSLNRFGSTFMTDDAFTSQFLTPSENGQVYKNAVDQKLVIKEINPNKVWQDSSKTAEGSAVTIAVNGTSVRLEEGVDYTVTVAEEGTGDSKWYVYTYEIDPSNFLSNNDLVDGSYSILLYGEDEAGNKNTNESNAYGSVQQDENGEYTGRIQFNLDHKAPVVSIMGVESGETYDAAFQKMQINLSDNSPAGVQVFLNDEEIPLSETMDGLADNQVWLAYDAETGNYVLNITEKNSDQNVRIVATDAAGNAVEEEVTDFLITTNTLVQLLNNPLFVGGTIALILALIIAIILMKKRKNAA